MERQQSAVEGLVKMRCRFCNKEITQLFVSLGSAPLSNAYLKKEQLAKKELSYLLDVYVCDSCFLVQLPEFESPENIFSDYAYFSSCSKTCMKHCEEYADKMRKSFGINKASRVIEIASNDGCLLRCFMKKGIGVLGIEPAANVAEAARKKGVPTEIAFFGTRTAKRLVSESKTADLLIGNNVLAHVPDLNDFVEGLNILLKPAGMITMEFPHLARLIDGRQFDTIYHEHFSYFSFLTASNVFSTHSLIVFDVEELPTHGGSLRIYVKHKADSAKPVNERVHKLLRREIEAGFADIKNYLAFNEQAKDVKRELLKFLSQVKRDGKIIVGYGAAAKGNTMLNYCGIKNDLIDYVADISPYKQGRYLPGSRIPIAAPDRIRNTKPDYVLILPWNIKEEIMDQLSYIRDWGGKFVIPIPNLKVIR